MKPDPHFPRMMFHRTKDPVTVYSQDELEALGEEWSKTIIPREEPPSAAPQAQEAVIPRADATVDTPEPQPATEEPPAKPVAHKTHAPPPRPKGRQRAR